MNGVIAGRILLSNDPVDSPHYIISPQFWHGSCHLPMGA
jgi:hypothetical protein